MFGISLSEIAVIATIALVVVGPQKLPGMLRTLGQWVRKLRKLTTEVRAQTGIDEILREEGIDGVHELRSLLRGEIAAARQHQRRRPAEDPYQDAIDFDAGREYPTEGPDSYHAIPDDLIDTATTEEPAPPNDAVAPSQVEPSAASEASPPAPPKGSEGATEPSAARPPDKRAPTLPTATGTSKPS